MFSDRSYLTLTGSKMLEGHARGMGAGLMLINCMRTDEHLSPCGSFILFCAQQI